MSLTRMKLIVVGFNINHIYTTSKEENTFYAGCTLYSSNNIDLFKQVKYYGLF